MLTSGLPVVYLPNINFMSNNIITGLSFFFPSPCFLSGLLSSEAFRYIRVL